MRWRSILGILISESFQNINAVVVTFKKTLLVKVENDLLRVPNHDGTNLILSGWSKMMPPCQYFLTLPRKESEIMNLKQVLLKGWLVLFVICCLSGLVIAQDSATILTGAELTRVVPTGFYFQGLSAPTQMRNSAAARFGSKRFVIAGLVDTAGYAADVRAKYEGFFITDSPIMINNSDLGTGAYGFGFSDDGKLQILDLAGNQVLTISTTKDSELKRPRPLMMTRTGNGVRFYSGRDYVTVTAK
jgi:hypothetical protein